MPCIEYIERNFALESRQIIAQANAICQSYATQGYDLTLRQLFYQFVSRDLLANTERSYKRLGSIVNDARLAGLLDWHFIVDRTRNLKRLAHWNDPPEAMTAIAEQFRVDRWADQPTRVEVWIEKDALVGVLESACPQLDVPYFSCRGYTSQSEIWGAAQRLGGYIDNGQSVVVLHLGDHDPSGIDMTRDIETRLAMFIAQDVKGAPPGLEAQEYLDEVSDWNDEPSLTIERIALNRDQIDHYNPPPNPAKLTDSRATGYIAAHGRSSWELDALEPTVLVELITEHVFEHRDVDKWDASTKAEEEEREMLTAAAERWDEVKAALA
jgi:hypothetical protein